MFSTISRFIKFNNLGIRRLNGLRYLFLSFCSTTRRIFEPLRIFEPGFNTDKYGKWICNPVCMRWSNQLHVYETGLHWPLLLNPIRVVEKGIKLLCGKYMYPLSQYCKYLGILSLPFNLHGLKYANFNWQGTFCITRTTSYFFISVL